MDSVILFPPGPSVAGSQLQIGTYLMYDPGADYGAKGLISSIESANALRDGGVFGFRSVGPRRMSFPLLLRDVPGQTLLQTESLLRQWSTWDAAVAIQPEGVPSGEAVFFDVIDGRWEPDYNSFENRAGRRRGTLYLDTQPWGYWPTEILLASSASVGWMGALPLNCAASLIGDVPPLAHVRILPTCASIYAPSFTSGTWGTDMIAWSLGAQPSFTPFFAPGSYLGPVATGDALAPASQVLVANMQGLGTTQWLLKFESLGVVARAVEPAFRGRFRAFAFLKVASLTAANPQFILDAPPYGLNFESALASSNQIATGYAFQAVAPTTPAPAFQIQDLGEITLPAAGSGISQQPNLRIWEGGSWANSATSQVLFGGLYLLPVDGAAGVLTRGLQVPSVTSAFQAGGEWNANWNEGVLGVVPSGGPYDLRAFHRGVAPRLGPSTNQLLYLLGDRPGGGALATVATSMIAQATKARAQVSVSYRPSFQFLHGL